MNTTMASVILFAVNLTTTMNVNMTTVILNSSFNINDTSTHAPTTTAAYKDPELNPTFLVIVEITCILVFFLGIIGNSLVLIVFGSRWSKLKNFEVSMMSLACADLISTIVVPLKMFLELVQHDFYPIGDVGCKIVSFLSMTSITVTALTLLVISIDRFLIVRWPLRKHPEPWKLGVTILSTWLIASSLSFLYLLGDRIRLYDDPADNIVVHFCRGFMDQHEFDAHTLITFVVQIVLPLTMMSVLYGLIVLELQKATKNTLFQHHEREIRLRLKRNRKATTLFVTIVTVYYMFVLPSNIFYLVYTFGTVDMPMNRLVMVYTLLQMILMLNSCANPIIYSNLHTSFRRTTLKLLCSCLFVKFKSYQWGDSVRSILRNSKRSVRGSFQSSRDLLFGRRKSADDFNQNNSVRNRNRSSELYPNYSPSQFTITKHFDEFDHYSMKEFRLKRMQKELIEGEDDVFDINGHTPFTPTDNSHSRKSIFRSSTASSSLNSPETPRTALRLLQRIPDRKKIMKLLKEQTTVEEEF